jgi:hypothetical protein
MAAQWKVTDLEYLTSKDGHARVVSTIHWVCIDQDENRNVGRCYGATAIETDDLSEFTEFSDLTEDQTIQWAKDAIGSEQVAALEANVAAQIAKAANPTKGNGVPW